MHLFSLAFQIFYLGNVLRRITIPVLETYSYLSLILLKKIYDSTLSVVFFCRRFTLTITFIYFNFSASHFNYHNYIFIRYSVISCKHLSSHPLYAFVYYNALFSILKALHYQLSLNVFFTSFVILQRSTTFNCLESFFSLSVTMFICFSGRLSVVYVKCRPRAVLVAGCT